MEKRKNWTKWEMQGEGGMSLVEIILIIAILAIALIPLSRLSVANLVSSGKHGTMEKVVSYAQERMEEVLADGASGEAGGGYEWATTYWSNQSDSPAPGLTRTVTISPEKTFNEVNYVVVQVTVSGEDISDFTLETWLTDYR
jgi:type II secretory pathway pseudopilin PulG